MSALGFATIKSLEVRFPRLEWAVKSLVAEFSEKLARLSVATG